MSKITLIPLSIIRFNKEIYNLGLYYDLLFDSGSDNLFFVNYRYNEETQIIEGQVATGYEVLRVAAPEFNVLMVIPKELIGAFDNLEVYRLETTMSAAFYPEGLQE